MFHFWLLLHIVSATVWTGGHLVLACTVLPKVLKSKDLNYLRRFEDGFEKIGIPSLIIQIITGFYLAYSLVPDISMWFSHENTAARLIRFKLFLLFITALLAMDARFRIIPKLSEKNIISLAWHIIPITIVSVLFVVVGVSFRAGWFF